MSRILYYNGKIITLNKAQPEADYLLSENGRISQIGIANGNMPAQINHVEKAVNLEGKTVIPGFIDSHMHMLTGAFSRMQIDVSNMWFETVEELLCNIKTSALSDGWIRATGFTEENIGEGRMPNRKDIDDIIGHQPVILTRCCGHLSVVNSAALQQMDETDMKMIRGGEFQTDTHGKYTGIITEAAQQYVLDRIPAPPADDIFKMLEAEQQSLIEKGICSIHDAGTDQVKPLEYIELYRTFADKGKLKIRTYLMVRPEDSQPFEEFAAMLKDLKSAYPPESSRLFFGAVKLFADGSIGGRTAAVSYGYTGQPENHGLLLTDRLDRYIKQIQKFGLQLSVHAIGDQAVQYVVDQTLQAEKEYGTSNALRHRIEHAELLNSELIQKLKDHGFLLMMQPMFITEFGSTYRKNLGVYAETIQPLRTLMETGIPVGFGTDYPVVDANPFLGIDSAVNRSVKHSDMPLNYEQQISFMDSLKAYTLMGAYGSFSEHLQGSLEKGKFADFVVIDEDWDQLVFRSHYQDLSVLKTIIGGETVYERNSSGNEY